MILSVLVVCVVGILMIPSAFADTTVTNAPGSATPGCEDTNSCFIPSTVTIQPGDTVTWEAGNADHTATAGSAADGPSGVFDSSLIMAGGSFSYTFDTAGSYDYFCMVHPWMTGTVIVEAGSSTPSQTPTTTSNSQTATSNFDLQKKLDEYLDCGNGESKANNRDCVKYDEKHIVGISITEIADYWIEKDGTLTFIYEDSNISKKLEKFRDQTLHQELWDIYTSITPKQILSEVVYFVVYTDDFGGDETASVQRDIDYPLKFDLFVDPVDMVPSGIKIDKQYYIATLIHENAHILSLNSEQGNNDGLVFKGPYLVDHSAKQRLLIKHADCAPNYYNDMAGCLYGDSYLNVFFQRFWAEIYPEHRWFWEFKTYDEYLEATNPFYFKYENQFVTEYAGDNPDEDFAESFMTFVLKEKPSQSAAAIPEQKILFFYEYPELVEMRDFIRSAIATSEYCDNGTVWKDGKCQKYVPPPPQQQTQQSKGGGCLIATAAFGSELAPQVQLLREIRDNAVLQTESGSAFMTGFNQFYYSFSPAIADYERENPAFKEAVKITLTPLLTSLTLLQYADIDSESEMLGYGIGIILLNIGMYFVAPAVLIMKIRKVNP